MWAIAAGTGPILGGTFSQLLSWRWNFWVNLPIAGITFILPLVFSDVHNPRTRAIDGIKAIDWFGTLSFLGLAVVFLLGLNFGGTVLPWSSAKVICLIVFGLLMSAVLIFSEKKLARYPLFPLSVFQNKSNVAGLLVTFFHGMVSCNCVCLDRS
jgi:MFS family permease